MSSNAITACRMTWSQSVLRIGQKILIFQSEGRITELKICESKEINGMEMFSCDIQELS